MLKNCNFSKAKVQGKRIINVFSIKLAFRHGFLVQNLAIMGMSNKYLFCHL